MSALEDLMAFQMNAVGVPEFVREHKFIPTRRFRFDFAWPEKKVALEIDGGSWVNGRHNRGAGFEADCVKSCFAAALGWRVLHVTGAMVKSGEALVWAEQAVSYDPRTAAQILEGKK